jgi:copper(I)-binding protein
MFMEIHRGLFLFYLVTALLLPGSVSAREPVDDIIVSHAWVRAMPPSVKNTAAYMTIENRTGMDIVLQSAGTDVARTVEIHRMEQAGDMMVMKKVDGLRIPAGESVDLRPDGFHLMIINLLKTLKEGETIPLVLYFEGGYRVTVKAVVHKWGNDGRI